MAKLGIELWRKDFMPKRYLVVCALVEMLSALVELVTFGWLMPQWKMKVAGYFSVRWLKPIWDAEEEEPNHDT